MLTHMQRARSYQRNVDYSRRTNGAVVWTATLDLALIAGVKTHGQRWSEVKGGDSLFCDILPTQLKGRFKAMC